MRYFHVYFRIDTGYAWGRGLEKSKTLAFYKEIRDTFEKAGWAIEEHHPYETIDVINGKTRLYVHPMELSGPCEESLIPVVEALLVNRTTFTHYRTDRYNELLDLEGDALMAEYHKKDAETDARLLNAFRSPDDAFYTVFDLAQKIRIPTLHDYLGFSSGEPAHVYARERFNTIVEKGLIKFNNETGVARTV